jgi:hypothetical protein
MTGVWYRSPYSFGDDQFKSLDLTRLHWFEILLHPLHGALIYHPLILLGLVRQIHLSRAAPTRREQITWLCWVAASAVTFLFHAGWYCWWMGLGVTFGMRGLLVPSYISILALWRWHYLRGVSQPAQPSDSNGIIDAFTCGALIWSWWLLIQGPTDYFSWSGLLGGQLHAFASWFKDLGPLRLLVAWWLMNLLIPYRSNPAWRATWRVTTATAEVLLTDWILSLLSTNAAIFLPRLGIALTIAFGVAGLGIWMVWRLADRHFLRLMLIPTTVLSVLLVGLFLSFLILVEAVPRSREEVAKRVDGFDWRESFYVPEPLAWLEAYERIPGYTSEQQSLYRFLTRRGIEVPPLTNSE